MIVLYSFLTANPNSNLAKAFRVLGIADKIEKIWQEKISLGLISATKEVGSDNSGISSYKIRKGSVGKPFSWIAPSFDFLFMPFTLFNHAGISLAIISLESPIWWSLYLCVGIQIFRFRARNLFKDKVLFFATSFLLAFVAVSSLIEVNLGTSIRHRSIILIPLVFIYLQAREKNEIANF